MPYERFIQHWYLPEDMLVSAEQYVNKVLNKPIDFEKMERFRKNFYFRNSKIEDYLNKEIRLCDDSKMLCGIRFRNGDLSKPFVEIILLETYPLQMNIIIDIWEKAIENYNIFNPIAVKLSTNQDLSTISLANFRICPQDIYLLTETCKYSYKSNNLLINLKLAEGLDWYEQYAKIYKSYEEQHPNSSIEMNWPTVESKDFFKVALEDKLLFEIYLDNKWIGVIAGFYDEFLNSRVIFLGEIIIKSEFRGRGFSKHIYHAFIDKIKSKNKYLVGTIYHDNKPALNSALSCNRRIIQRTYFLC